MKRFIESNLVISEIELKSPLSVNGYYIKASNFMDLNNRKIAQEIIDQCLSLSLDSLFQLKFKILDYENKSNLDEDYCEKLKEFLNTTKLSYDYENTEFALDKLIEYYESKFIYKTANLYLKEKIQHIENKFSN